jgi:hypothetical protein
MQEIASGDAASLAAWTIRSGRLLRFGPDWPESSDRLAFDACSGDYWVLDALGHHVVQRLLGDGSRSSADMSRDCAPAAESGFGTDVLEPALSRLFEAGLIQPRAPAP